MVIEVSSYEVGILPGYHIGRMTLGAGFGGCALPSTEVEIQLCSELLSHVSSLNHIPSSGSEVCSYRWVSTFILCSGLQLPFQSVPSGLCKPPFPRSHVHGSCVFWKHKGLSKTSDQKAVTFGLWSHLSVFLVTIIHKSSEWSAEKGPLPVLRLLCFRQENGRCWAR